MEKMSLTAMVRQQLSLAQNASSGRSAHTVYGGHEHVLRQTMIAMMAGQMLNEHENPGEATVHVLHGRSRRACCTAHNRDLGPWSRPHVLVHCRGMPTPCRPPGLVTNAVVNPVLLAVRNPGASPCSSCTTGSLVTPTSRVAQYPVNGSAAATCGAD